MPLRIPNCIANSSVPCLKFEVSIIVLKQSRIDHPAARNPASYGYMMHSDVSPALLVMTATINPFSNVFWSDRNDPAVRLEDYCEALEFYLNRCKLIDRIVFVENSNSNLAPLQQIVENHRGGKQVEFVSFYGQDYPAEYTRGYGELRSLDHAFRNSRLMSQLKDEDKCWKVTGRYRATNLDRLIRTAPPSYDLYADFRWWKKLTDVRLFSFSRGGYERLLLGRYLEMKGVMLEEYFFSRFTALIEEKGEKVSGIIPEFYYVPRIEGIGALQNMNYMRGKLRMIYHARSTLRFFKNLVRPSRWNCARYEVPRDRRCRVPAGPIPGRLHGGETSDRRAPG